MREVIIEKGTKKRLKGSFYHNVHFIGKGGSLTFRSDDIEFADVKFSGDFAALTAEGMGDNYWTSKSFNYNKVDMSKANVQHYSMPYITYDYDKNKLPKLRLAETPDGKYYIGYKKLRADVVLELHINKRQTVIYGFQNQGQHKLRVKQAKVARVIDNPENVSEFRSKYDYGFIYEVGKTVKVNNFSTDRWASCAPGIHFFHTLELARAY